MLLAVYFLELKVNLQVFVVGLQSVNVWPLTKLRADKSTAVAARGVESILYVFRDLVRDVLELGCLLLKGSGSCIAGRSSQKVLKRVLSECVDKGRAKDDADRK